MEYFRYLVCRSRYTLIVVLLLLSNFSMNSQSVDLIFTTTYSSLPALDGQKVSQDNKMFVNLILNDFSIKNYNVRLKLSIEGNGVLISSNNLYNYNKFTLISGVPKMISSFELGDYFNPEALDFSGIDKNTFLENGILPEGNYKICFTVIDGESDGANELSIAECDFLPLKHTDSPIILSSISDAILTNTILWKSTVFNEDELEYELVAYEYKGGDVNSAPIYQLPIKRIKVTNQLVDIKAIVKDFENDKLYTFFIHAKSKLGFNHFVKNNGFSKGLLFESQLRTGGCNENPVLEEPTIIEGPDGLEYIHFTMEGCDPYIPPQYPNLVPNLYPYVDGTGYDLQFHCANDDCRYEFEYGDQNCVVGEECETIDGCYGRIDYGCECDPWCVQIDLNQGMVDGDWSLIPDVPTDCSLPATYLWSDGSISSTVKFPNTDATFSVEVTCKDGCTYCGIINSRGNCRVGDWCNDGNPCTIYDKWDANCDCVGTLIDHCDEDDPVNTGGCADDLTISVSQAGDYYYLIASTDCTPIKYMWNGDENLTSGTIVLFQLDGLYTLEVLCNDGCSYSATIDLTCTPGAPCDDDNDPTTIEVYNEVCDCTSYPCPDTDNDGLPDDCDQNQSCNGNIGIIHNTDDQLLTADVSDLECPDEVSYLWTTGATTATIPLNNPSATYSVTVTCSTGCQYTEMKEGTVGGCIIGEPCVGASCTGQAFYDENCNCIAVDPDYEFIPVYNTVLNGVTLTVEVDESYCNDPKYTWSDESEEDYIILSDLSASYIVTVTCNGGCSFIATYNGVPDDCIVGLPCIHTDLCIVDEVLDENCECNGEYATDNNGNPITENCTDDDCCTPGTLCDDGIDCTIDDMIQDDCSCLGTVPAVESFPSTEAYNNCVQTVTEYTTQLCDICGPCDDGLDCTYNDMINADCECEGTPLNDADGNPIDCDDDPVPCYVGYPCNDNNPCTVDDVFDANCDCEGIYELDGGGNPITENCVETNPCDAIVTMDVIPTANYNEIVLSAVTNCEVANPEVETTYQWSNGSSAASIVVPTQSGPYILIVTCGACQYLISYDTDGCLVGLPCNDGLDCTENDEVQDNCECEGEPIEDIEIELLETVETEMICDYFACLPYSRAYTDFTINSVDVILPSGIPFQLNKGLNSQGFDFPYCYQEFGGGCTVLPDVSVLASDITNWMGVASSYAYIHGIDLSLTSCNVSETFRIVDSPIMFTSINGYNEFGDYFSIPFEAQVPCTEGSTPIGVTVEAIMDCIVYDVNDEVIPNEFLWSDGSSGSSVYIPYNANGDLAYCLEVTVSCTNGCTYTAIYGNNCDNCEFPFYGAPCDDGDPCTINDTADENCNCLGQNLPDGDGDQYCDDVDICPLGDDDIDLDDDGIPDACDGDIDCSMLLYAEIDIELLQEECVYCVMLDHPLFTDPLNNEDIYLQSISVIYNGEPQLLDHSYSEFSFPYLIDKTSDVYLPDLLITHLYGYFDENSEFTLTKLPGNICQNDTENTSPSLEANLKLPSKLLQMTFAWGGDNIFEQNFYPSPEEACESTTPYTLTAQLITTIVENCGAEPLYFWSNGSTESSIQVPSLAPSYSVTITCGECSPVVSTIPTIPNCVIGADCPGKDACDNDYDGVYDEYCNCIPNSELPNYPTYNGIVDCSECDAEYIQVVDGAVACCDDPPTIVFEEEPVKKLVYNSCFRFDEDDIITGFDIKGIKMNENSDINDYFDFPYCIQGNCSYYGEDIGTPFNLKTYKSFAYDLQKWAAFKGFEFKVSIKNDVVDNENCDACEVGDYIIYINESDTDEKLYIRINNAVKSMNTCDAIFIDNGYKVVFGNYDNNCKVVRIEAKTKNSQLNPFIIEDQNGLDLSLYEIGPVPHMGVGFRAILTVVCEEDGESTKCIYDIVTPNADCIVGDPCNSSDICATETYTTYNNEDCFCEVLVFNDADNDGICDDEDMCPGLNDNLDNDNDGIPNCLDDVCGVDACTYTLDLASIQCNEPGDGCLNINSITVKLPDTRKVSLGKLPFFSESFDIGSICNNDQSEELAKYIKRWFLDNGYVVGDVIVEDFVLTISGSNIEFLYASNGCEDEVEFLEECTVRSMCIANIESCPVTFTCSGITLIDQILLYDLNGIEIELDLQDNNDGFNFPYQVDYNGDSGLNISNSWALNFKDDFMNSSIAENSDIVLYNVEFVDGEFHIESNVDFSYIIIGCDTDNEMGCRVFFTCDPVPNSCDDGWACTINDHYDADCNCVGTFQDSDDDTVCDADDICNGHSDLVDMNYNGTPDGCEPVVVVECTDGDIPFCEYLTNVIGDGTSANPGMSTCYDGKMEQNNMIAINDFLAEKLSEKPENLIYLPFPILKKQLEGQKLNPLAENIDKDRDGIVNILDPSPTKNAYDLATGAFLPEKIGTHRLDDDDTKADIYEYCSKILLSNEEEDEYVKERALLLRTYMFTVNPGVLAGTNDDDSFPRYSPCFFEKIQEYALTFGYNESGHLYSITKGCYVYFELDCYCDCVVVESNALNYGGCDPVIGVQCTDDPHLEGVDGYQYIQCPPADAEPCFTYGVVANPAYDGYEHEQQGTHYAETPCKCAAQPIGDADGDGICDMEDPCPGIDDDVNGDGEVDDTDMDGVPDCLDKCEGVGFVDTPEEQDLTPASGDPILIYATKDGLSTPTGPGDVCDDGNPCTYDDVITLDCQCQGVYIDLDDDGVYDCEECEYVETEEGSGMYACVGCDGEVLVDEVGNVTDPNDPEANPVAHTWRGCDVCPGIPDGDPEDQDDFPMDYNNNGLPDCIDPPYREICPDEFKIVLGVGLVLRFYTDNLAEEDYPEPIKFQATISSTGNLYQADYLTIDFVREVVDEDGAKYTEIIYAHDSGDYITEDFLQAQIVYADHQTCLLGADDFVPLACPYYVNIANEVLKFESESGDLDLSEILGTFIFDDGINTFEFDASTAATQFVGYQLWFNPLGVGLPDLFDDPFNGTITMPSGLVCPIVSGTSGKCELEDGTEVTIGQPCDDGLICTHHDKYIDDGSGDCVCVGEYKPDEDDDGFCDAIDPCPEDWNSMPESMDVADIDDCPCPMLELSTFDDEQPGLENATDFIIYLNGDLTSFSDISIIIDNGQPDIIEKSGIAPVSPIIATNLEQGYEYTITLTVTCANGSPQTLTFTVDVPFDDNPIICGKELEPFDLSSFTRLLTLSAGDEFTAADFMVTATKVEGGSGNFSGKGYINVPYFNQARINVSFKNIVISSEKQMLDGYIEVDGFGLAILGDDISDAINNALDDIVDGLETATEILEVIIPVLEDIEEWYDLVQDLLDPETKLCIETNTALLEEKKLALQNNPSEEEVIALKQQIEQLSAILKGCQEDADVQINQNLENVFTFMKEALMTIEEDCDYSESGVLYQEYLANIGDMQDVFATEKLTIESQFGAVVENDLEEDENPIYEYTEDVPNDIEPELAQELIAFYSPIAAWDYCISIQKLKNHFVGQSEPSIEDAKLLLELYLSVGADFHIELSVDVKQGMSIEDLLVKWRPVMEPAFMKVFLNKAYGQKSE